MKVIEAARAHFQAIGMQSIEVPEWQVDGAPLRIYWTPLTVWERREIAKPDKSDADILVLKARNADGSRMFTIDDREPLLRSVDDSVVRRVAFAMFAAPTVKELEKN